MDDIKAKQQLLEKITSATNILVTVSDNPTVDALSAAIGLTLLLDKMDKHATAVFSGVVPPAIAFLEPEKILDDTTDSLRDFIIALDKEKADHLRYKVEGDSVKIFITPYKTTITSDDLVFSQGDYNVELVIALGVDDQDHLDNALESHGKILHDATVATITAGDQTSSLGGIDWHDEKASSLSEMLAGLSEALKSDKNKSLVTAQIATAYLTGIVAQTERFSNRNTTAKVMTVASQLMAAGADQQLIATKLDEPVQTYPDPVEEDEALDEEAPAETDTVSADGTLKIGKHKDAEPAPVKAEPSLRASDVDDNNDDDDDDDDIPPSSSAFETLEQLDHRVKAHEQAEAAIHAEAALNNLNHSSNDEIDSEPTFGSALTATTEQAADDARREEDADHNKTILQHSYLQPSEPAIDTASVEDTSKEAPNAYMFDEAEASSVAPTLPQPPTTSHLDSQSEPVQPPVPVEPVAPAAPVDLGLPMPPPLPDFTQGVPPLAGPYAPPSDQPPAILGDILAPEPSVPSPQDVPVDPSGPYAPPIPPSPPPSPADPGQFKIPGQQ